MPGASIETSGSEQQPRVLQIGPKLAGHILYIPTYSTTRNQTRKRQITKDKIVSGTGTSVGT